MADTYTNIIIHLVFAVRHREALILPNFREELQKIMTGSFRKYGQKVLAIYCMPDHVHILFDHRPSIGLSDLVKNVKAATTIWIRDMGFLKSPFNWQYGYGAFSCHGKKLDGIIHYILNQEEHHFEKKFSDEYKELLQDLQIKYDERNLFVDISEGKT